MRFFLMALVIACASAAAADIVPVEGGMVRGITVNGMTAFKGIPFAQAPVGQLRWRAPQPLTRWKGTLDASAFKPDCVQLPTEGTSEDCLYANVWRPVRPGFQRLPVMVWIYGGGLVRGGAAMYPGEFLARQGIVVVSFNHRLGRFGFFAHPALASEGGPRGNYGYMDQIAALQWVQRNIAAFGGNPGNVTIAGESAGGGSVLALLTSPIARGLFHRAILQSAGIPTPRAAAAPMRDLATAESMAVEFTRAAGIKSDGAEAIAALRALAASKLAEGTDPENPIIDGRIIVRAPEATLREGRQAMVPVISGANDHDLAQSPLKTKDALFDLFGPLAPKARAFYDPKGDGNLENLIQSVIADRTMVEPSRFLAESMAKAGQPAYFYRFSYVAQRQRGKVPGAAHGAEVPYAFDALSVTLADKAAAADVAMARIMSGYWVAFVRSGDPNGGDRPKWPRFDPAAPRVLNFTNMGAVYGPDPLKARLDLWRSASGAP